MTLLISKKENNGLFILLDFDKKKFILKARKPLHFGDPLIKWLHRIELALTL